MINKCLELRLVKVNVAYHPAAGILLPGPRLSVPDPT